MRCGYFGSRCRKGHLGRLTHIYSIGSVSVTRRGPTSYVITNGPSLKDRRSTATPSRLVAIYFPSSSTLAVLSLLPSIRACMAGHPSLTSSAPSQRARALPSIYRRNEPSHYCDPLSQRYSNTSSRSRLRTHGPIRSCTLSWSRIKRGPRVMTSPQLSNFLLWSREFGS